MSYSLNLLQAGYRVDSIGVIKGATRSLEYSSQDQLNNHLRLSPLYASLLEL